MTVPLSKKGVAAAQRVSGAKAKRDYAQTSLGQIHYRYAGEGNALLLLHHAPSSSHFFERLMGALAPSFSVVALDLPGCGMSDYPPHPYTIQEHAQVVLQSLDALKIGRCSILGNYTGAAIACEMAATAPGRVDKLVLASAPCYGPAEQKKWLGKMEPLVLAEDGRYFRELWSYLGRLAPQGRDLSLEDKHEEMVWRLRAGPRFIELFRAVFTYDMPGRLPRIAAPTLVVSGELDTVRDAAERTASLLKRSRLCIVPGGTKWLLLEQAEEMAVMVRDFLTKDVV